MAPRQPKTQPGTEVVDWEAQMREQATIAAEATRASAAGGKFLSLQAGNMKYNDNAMPGNQVACIIIGAVMENSYYDADFDPAVPASPKCFAFAEREDDLEPHSAVDNDPYFERQHEVCQGCPQNQWGSARKGRGKACGNLMRLCIIPAGEWVPDGKGRNAALKLNLWDKPEDFAKTEPAFIKIPVMSVKNYTKYVKELALTGRPPWGVATNIFLTPDERSQFQVNFELLDTLGNDILNVTMPRHASEQASIDFPYGPPMEKDAPAPKANVNKLSQGRAAPRKR